MSFGSLISLDSTIILVETKATIFTRYAQKKDNVKNLDDQESCPAYLHHM